MTQRRETGSRETGNRFIPREEFEAFERRVGQSFEDVGRALESLGHKIDNIRTKGTPWQTIFAGLGVFAAFFFGIGGAVSWGLLEKVGSIESRLTYHEQLPGHAQELARIATIEQTLRSHERRIEDLDTVLQREMRLLDSQLQAEMRLLDGQQTKITEAQLLAMGERVKAIAQRLDELRDHHVHSVGDELRRVEGRLDLVERLTHRLGGQLGGSSDG